MLCDAAETHKERNKMYGDAYKKFGGVMSALFPDGVKLETDDDHNRFGVLVMIVGKLTRYAPNFKPEPKEFEMYQVGHADSLRDLSVYAAMLAELDDEFNNNEAAAYMAMESFFQKDD